MKKETFQYPSLKARIKNEYRIIFAAFVFILIADAIGQIEIPLGPGKLILFPIFYALILGVLSGPEILKFFKKKEVKAASKLVIVAICPFIAKLGINAGASIEVVLSAGPALLLQEIGNLGTIFLALPFALLLGLKREAIGATHSINRESNLRRRRYGRDDLFWVPCHDDGGSGNLPSICTWNGIRSRSGNSDGKCDGKYHGCLSGYGGGAFRTCKYK